MSKRRVIVVIVIAIFVLVALSGQEEVDPDPLHYNYYKCTHCNGSGRLHGYECKWCNGTGYSVLLKDDYQDRYELSEGQAFIIAVPLIFGFALLLFPSLRHAIFKQKGDSTYSEGYMDSASSPSADDSPKQMEGHTKMELEPENEELTRMKEELETERTKLLYEERVPMRSTQAIIGGIATAIIGVVVFFGDWVAEDNPLIPKIVGTALMGAGALLCLISALLAVRANGKKKALIAARKEKIMALEHELEELAKGQSAGTTVLQSIEESVHQIEETVPEEHKSKDEQLTKLREELENKKAKLVYEEHATGQNTQFFLGGIAAIVCGGLLFYAGWVDLNMQWMTVSVGVMFIGAVLFFTSAIIATKAKGNKEAKIAEMKEEISALEHTIEELSCAKDNQCQDR